MEPACQPGVELRFGRKNFGRLSTVKLVRTKKSRMYKEESEAEDVLSVLACTQKLNNSNERVLSNLDSQQGDYKAAIDDFTDKQEQVKTMKWCQIRAFKLVFAPVNPTSTLSVCKYKLKLNHLGSRQAVLTGV